MMDKLLDIINNLKILFYKTPKKIHHKNKLNLLDNI